MAFKKETQFDLNKVLKSGSWKLKVSSSNSNQESDLTEPPLYWTKDIPNNLKVVITDKVVYQYYNHSVNISGLDFYIVYTVGKEIKLEDSEKNQIVCSIGKWQNKDSSSTSWLDDCYFSYTLNDTTITSESVEFTIYRKLLSISTTGSLKNKQYTDEIINLDGLTYYGTFEGGLTKELSVYTVDEKGNYSINDDFVIGVAEDIYGTNLTFNNENKWLLTEKPQHAFIKSLYGGESESFYTVTADIDKKISSIIFIGTYYPTQYTLSKPKLEGLEFKLSFKDSSSDTITINENNIKYFSYELFDSNTIWSVNTLDKTDDKYRLIKIGYIYENQDEVFCNVIIPQIKFIKKQLTNFEYNKYSATKKQFTEGTSLNPLGANFEVTYNSGETVTILYDDYTDRFSFNPKTVELDTSSVVITYSESGIENTLSLDYTDFEVLFKQPKEIKIISNNDLLPIPNTSTPIDRYVDYKTTDKKYINIINTENNQFINNYNPNSDYITKYFSGNKFDPYGTDKWIADGFKKNCLSVYIKYNNDLEEYINTEELLNSAIKEGKLILTTTLEKSFNSGSSFNEQGHGLINHSTHTYNSDYVTCKYTNIPITISVKNPHDSYQKTISIQSNDSSLGNNRFLATVVDIIPISLQVKKINKLTGKFQYIDSFEDMGGLRQKSKKEVTLEDNNYRLEFVVNFNDGSQKTIDINDSKLTYAVDNQSTENAHIWTYAEGEQHCVFTYKYKGNSYDNDYIVERDIKGNCAKTVYNYRIISGSLNDVLQISNKEVNSTPLEFEMEYTDGEIVKGIKPTHWKTYDINGNNNSTDGIKTTYGTQEYWEKSENEQIVEYFYYEKDTDTTVSVKTKGKPRFYNITVKIADESSKSGTVSIDGTNFKTSVITKYMYREDIDQNTISCLQKANSGFTFKSFTSNNSKISVQNGKIIIPKGSSGDVIITANYYTDFQNKKLLSFNSVGTYNVSIKNGLVIVTKDGVSMTYNLSSTGNIPQNLFLLIAGGGGAGGTGRSYTERC